MQVPAGELRLPRSTALPDDTRRPRIKTGRLDVVSLLIRLLAAERGSLERQGRRTTPARTTPKVMCVESRGGA